MRGHLALTSSAAGGIFFLNVRVLAVGMIPGARIMVAAVGGDFFFFTENNLWIRSKDWRCLGKI